MKVSHSNGHYIFMFTAAGATSSKLQMLCGNMQEDDTQLDQCRATNPC